MAQTYKNELGRIEISDDDIQHLHNTVEKRLEIFKTMSPNAPIETFEQIKELISMDTLKAIQLLGFNYKTAVREPLTLLLVDKDFFASFTNYLQSLLKACRILLTSAF